MKMPLLTAAKHATCDEENCIANYEGDLALTPAGLRFLGVIPWSIQSLNLPLAGEGIEASLAVRQAV